MSPQRRGALWVLVLLECDRKRWRGGLALAERLGDGLSAVFLSLFDIVGLDEGTCGRRLLRVLAHSRCVGVR